MLDRQRSWPIGMIGAALVLAYLAQKQLERPAPQLLLGLALFAVAAGLFLVSSRIPTAWLDRLSPGSVLLLLLSSVTFLVALYVHSQPRPTAGVPAIAWLVAITAFVLGCWQLDRGRDDLQPLHLRWTRVDILLLVVSTGLAVVLRFIGLDRAPLTMNGDEGSMAMEAVRVIQGKITDPFATGWLSHPTLWFFLQSYSLRIFGETLAGVRMLSALIGSATVATTYLLARLLYSRWVAAIAALLLATYHFHIHFSRLGLNNIADPFFGTLILIGLTVGIRTRRWFAFGLTGIALGLALYFYHGTRLFIPLVLLLGIVRLVPQLWHSRQWGPFRRWAVPLVILVGVLLAAGPLLQTFYENPQEFVARVKIEGVTWSWVEEEAINTGQTRGRVLLDQFQRALLAFNSYPDRSDFYDTRRPLLWGLAAALMILGLSLALGRSREWAYQVPVAWFLLAVILGGMLLKAPPKSPRYITLAPVVCLFIAFAAERILHAGQQLLPRWRVAPQILAGALVIYLGTVSVRGYFHDYLAREELGGVNTHTANALAEYLRSQPAGTKVWFFGAPRMYYHGFALLDFLVPDIDAADVIDPLHVDPIQKMINVPPPTFVQPTVYAVLPERKGELQIIQRRYPRGELQALHWPLRSEPLLYVYRIPGQAGDGSMLEQRDSQQRTSHPSSFR